MERTLIAVIFLATTTLACLSRAAVVTLRNGEASTCNGSVAECGKEEVEEMEMESWISQRMMEEQRTISYGALKRNQPACGGDGAGGGQRGDSYSGSCLPPPSNPHSRGCSKYYRCRSDS
ncbi:PREDICTED: protein RALF-like 32 [Tarenaya hassleriana]|uniref:protein RALF-like 32 n=1 Tax=Tarenaya hassleriana TaxID=28532 RepID=UPI00053C7976|nr:PREDICTED: protein RALF-like 32 [Tarenaya hassleriana]